MAPVRELGWAGSGMGTAGSASKYLYIARTGHPNEVVYGENLTDYFAGVGVPAREIVLNPEGANRPELQACLGGDALAVLGPNWHLDHSCIGDRVFLDLA